MAESLNLRPSERRLLVGVGLVVFVVVNLWFVWPRFDDLKQVRNKRAEAMLTIARYQDEIARKPEREAEVKRLESAGSNVTGEDQAIELLRAIRNQAVAHGVEITGASRPGTRTNDFFVEKSQNVSTLSGEAELVNFLYELGSDNATIRVRELTIRPDQPRYKLSTNIKLVSSHRLTAPAGKKLTGRTTTARK